MNILNRIMDLPNHCIIQFFSSLKSSEYVSGKDYPFLVLVEQERYRKITTPKVIATFSDNSLVNYLVNY